MRFHIIVDVTSAGGTQMFAVEAKSEDEAKRVFKEQGGEFVSEDVEVYAFDSDCLTVETAD